MISGPTAIEPSLTVFKAALLTAASAVETAVRRLFKMAMGLTSTFRICEMWR